MSDEPTTWQHKVQERHLDLLLAEELECNQAFALWLHLERMDVVPAGGVGP